MLTPPRCESLRPSACPLEPLPHSPSPYRRKRVARHCRRARAEASDPRIRQQARPGRHEGFRNGKVRAGLRRASRPPGGAQSSRVQRSDLYVVRPCGAWLARARRAQDPDARHVFTKNHDAPEDPLHVLRRRLQRIGWSEEDRDQECRGGASLTSHRAPSGRRGRSGLFSSWTWTCRRAAGG